MFSTIKSLLIAALLFPTTLSSSNNTPNLSFNNLEVGDYFVYEVFTMDYNIETSFTEAPTIKNLLHVQTSEEPGDVIGMFYVEHITSTIQNPYTKETCFVVERSYVLKTTTTPIKNKKTTFLYSQKNNERPKNCGIMVNDLAVFTKPITPTKMMFEDSSTYETVIINTSIITFKFEQLKFTNVIYNQGVAITNGTKKTEYTEYVLPDVGVPILVVTSGAVLKLVEWENPSRARS